MSDVASVGTVLNVLAGVSLLLAIVMALSWGTRSRYPGFGLWTISNVVLAACCIVLANRHPFPAVVITLVLPWLAVVAAAVRLQGVSRFLMRERFDYTVVVLPGVALVLLCYFWFVHPNDLARALVTAGSISLILGGLGVAMIPWGRRERSLFVLLIGVLFTSYAALLAAYAIFWAVDSGSLPLAQLTKPNLAFGVLVIVFEIASVVVILTLGNWRETQRLQTARAAAESARQQLATMVDFLPDATFAVDRDLNMIGWNRAAEQLTGIPAESVLGKSYRECCLPSLTVYEETLLDLVLDPGREMPARYVNARWDGDRLSAEYEAHFPLRAHQGRHLWLTATVLRDRTGAVVGAVESMRDVSTREQAERQAQKVLRESEARLIQALAVAEVGEYEVDLVVQSLWMSPEALRIHGLEGHPSYVPLDKVDTTLLFDDPKTVVGRLKKLVDEGGPFETDYQVRRARDKALRTVRARGQVVSGDAGTPAKVVGVIQDVSELHRVEDAIRLTQDSVDNTDEQIYWVGSDGRFMYVSDSACEQLGYGRDELLAMTIFDVNPAARASWEEVWERVKEAGTLTVVNMHHTKDGREVSMEVSITYISHGGRDYHFVFARDVSRRKDMEEALRRTQLTVDNSNDQVFWLSSEGRLVFVADSTCRQLGYARDELLRMTIYDLDPTLSKDWQGNWETAKRRGSLVREGVHRAKDGRDVPVEVSVHYISHAGQEYNLVFARDITERKRAEQLLELSQERMKQNATMEAIGQLAGGIAHDFNNLLTAIIGYGNLILSNEEAQGTVSRDAEEIRAAAVRASALTHQILAFARRQTLRPELVTLNEVVSAALPALRQILGAEVEVVTRLQSEPSYVEIDTAQFEQVLVNLAANSHDAMPDGGQVIIEVRDVYLDEEYCRVYEDLRPGSYVLLSVADTGEGMSLETMGHIFEPFFTTKAPGAGPGLGLSTVYGIVRQSGGYVNVYSEIGKGTTFKIYLPGVAARPEAQGNGSGATQAASLAGSETVLVVEDEAAIRRLVARVLGGLGYTVFVAGSGPEALELLDELDGSPDLLLTDVVLPGGMLGNEVAAAFTERVPGLPVLYVSGHARDAIVHSGRLDEGMDFLSKPFTPESLAGKVREVLDAHNRRN